MKFKIGFSADNQNKFETLTSPLCNAQTTPRKSVAQVNFPERNMTLAYYNDLFDLKPGNIVFVDGKLEGMRGFVTEVNYNFKIKLSDYKRVIAVADTNVNGQFFMAGSHFVSFDSKALPREKVRTWFIAPQRPEDEIISGSDDTKFHLDNLKDMKVSPQIADRGHKYYIEDKVVYICIDGEKGYAIVEGSKPYEVEFEYHDGEISALNCSCFCSYKCKHQFAAMLQLKETLEIIGKNYENERNANDYFAAIRKNTLFNLAICSKEKGSFTL
ncbi:MAG: hypothetical protein IKV79_04660 [Oscillospiraceae bacterium]|nr:hypothetical protein [Oscillospiraceae bacterium]